MTLRDPKQEERRKRQNSRAKVMAIVLGLFVILLYFISIAKMTIGQ